MGERKGDHADSKQRLPQRRAELVEAARPYLPLVRAEPGVEAVEAVLYQRREKMMPIRSFSTRSTGRKKRG